MIALPGLVAIAGLVVQQGAGISPQSLVIAMPLCGGGVMIRILPRDDGTGQSEGTGQSDERLPAGSCHAPYVASRKLRPGGQRG